jgi:hypothetical protein
VLSLEDRGIKFVQRGTGPQTECGRCELVIAKLGSPFIQTQPQPVIRGVLIKRSAEPLRAREERIVTVEVHRDVFTGHASRDGVEPNIHHLDDVRNACI